MSNTRDFLYSEDSDDASQHGTSDIRRAEAFPGRTKNENIDITDTKLYDLHSENATTSAEILLLLGQCIGGPTKEFLENLNEVHSLPENSSLHGSSSELSDIFTETGYPEINGNHLLDDILLRSIEAMNTSKPPRKKIDKNADSCSSHPAKLSHSRKQTGSKKKLRNVNQKLKTADNEVSFAENFNNSSTNQQNQENVSHDSTDITHTKRRLTKRRFSRAGFSEVQKVPLQCKQCFAKFKNVMAYNLHQVVHRKKNSMKAKPREQILVLSNCCTNDSSERLLTERFKSSQTTSEAQDDACDSAEETTNMYCNRVDVKSSSNCHLCARVLPLRVAIDQSKWKQTSNNLSAFHIDGLSKDCSDEETSCEKKVSTDEEDNGDYNQGFTNFNDSHISPLPKVSKCSASDYCTRTVDFQSQKSTMYQHHCARVLTFETHMQKKSTDMCTSDDTTSQISSTAEECQGHGQRTGKGHGEKMEEHSADRSKPMDCCARVNTFDHHLLSKASDEALKEISNIQLKSGSEDAVMGESFALNNCSQQRECFINKDGDVTSNISCHDMHSDDKNYTCDGKEKLTTHSDCSAVCARVQTYQTYLRIKYSKEAREYMKYSNSRSNDDTCISNNTFTETDINMKCFANGDDSKCLAIGNENCLTSCDEKCLASSKCCTAKVIKFYDVISEVSGYTSSFDSDTCSDYTHDVHNISQDGHNPKISRMPYQYLKNIENTEEPVSHDISATGSAVDYRDEENICHATQTLSSMEENECLTYEAHVGSSSGFSFNKHEIGLSSQQQCHPSLTSNFDSNEFRNGPACSAYLRSNTSCNVGKWMISESGKDDSNVSFETKMCKGEDQKPVHLNLNIKSPMPLSFQSHSKPEMRCLPSLDLISLSDYVKSPKKRWCENYHNETKKESDFCGIFSDIYDLSQQNEKSVGNVASQKLIKSADQVFSDSGNVQDRRLTYNTTADIDSASVSNVQDRRLTYNTTADIDSASVSNLANDSNLLRDLDHPHLQQCNSENKGVSELSSDSSDDNCSGSDSQADHSNKKSDHCSRTRQYVTGHDGVCARVAGLPFWPGSSRTRPFVHKSLN